MNDPPPVEIIVTEMVVLICHSHVLQKNYEHGENTKPVQSGGSGTEVEGVLTDHRYMNESS